MKITTIKLLGFEVSEVIPSTTKDSQLVINTINPHSYCLAQKDTHFKQSLNSSDILLPDGIGIVYAAKILLRKRIRRTTGSELHQHLIEKANKEGLKIFYLGTSQDKLQKIQNRLAIEHPNCIVGIYSPPYKAEFSPEDNTEMIAAVNAFVPDILFVGMTAPKQEKWVHVHKAQISARIICSIGAVFDFYAGTVKRPHPIWIKLGLEWFPRLLREPRRLWRRTFISSPLFFVDVFKFKMSELAKNRSYKRD